jgi:folate-binding protein YgfZ
MEKLDVGARTLAGLHNPQGRVVALLRVVRTSPDEFLASLPVELVAPVAARLRKYVLRAKLKVEELSGGHALFSDNDSPGRALSEIHAGLPEVYASTSESFVAQMLNLDLLGAIAFDKGCYTGQEVVARAHYRGRVKRRMQRWLNAGAALKPGDAARSTHGRALTVVRVADAGNGEQAVLAVGNFGGDSAADPAPVADGAPLLSGPLPLPYSLPE